MSKQPVILNQSEYDKPADDFELPMLVGPSAPFSMDFLASDNLETVEHGIRTIDQTSSMLRIVQGLAILKAEELWFQSNLSSLHAYRKEANKRYGLSRAAVSNLRKIAYAWKDNVKLLRKLDLTGKAAHLLYLQEALNRHQDKKLVIDHFKNDSSRDFQAWAQGDGSKVEDLVPDVDVTVAHGHIVLDGRPLLAFDDALPDEERSFIGKILRAGYKAREGNCLAHVVSVYDAGEARAVDRFIKELRAKK